MKFMRRPELFSADGRAALLNANADKKKSGLKDMEGSAADHSNALLTS